MNRLLQTIQGAARWAACLGYFALCGRFLIVTGRTCDSAGAFALVVGATAVVTWWNPRAAFEAFLLLLPLVFALGRLGILAFGAPEMVVFASMSVVLMVRWLCLRLSRNGRLARDTISRPLWERRLVLLADLLAAWTLFSLIRPLPEILREPAHRGALWGQAIFGFSDPMFPVTDTLIWLTGWFFLRLLLAGDGNGMLRRSSAAPGTDSAQSGGPTDRFMLMSMSSWAACTLTFFLVQVVLGLPEGFGYVGNFGAPTSMFSDPHSLGSVAAALALSLLGYRGLRAGSARIGAVCLAISLLVLVCLCYSRAAWLASIVTLGLLLHSWRPSLAVGFAGAIFILLGLVAWKADGLLTLDHRYLARLVYLVRPDRAVDYRDARVEIYRRAPAMIAAHPLLGHGPGSSRVASAAFMAPGDTWGPDFMHNTVLQTTVEQGVPAGVLYAGLLLLPLALALARWGSVRADALASGAFYGMIAYMITQMSSNSLNVYADQQFFFWSLAAILVFRLRAVGDTTGKPSASSNPRLAT